MVQAFNYSAYEELTDMEWIEKLLSVPPIESVHHYFFKIKCNGFLQYVAKNILKTDCVESILGEFYEFLSKDDWHVLRMYRGKNKSSLSSYLSRCTVRYFMRKESEKNKNICVSIDDDVISQVEEPVTEDNSHVYTFLWNAFEQLNERDRKLLLFLVVEGRSTLDVADDIWKYVDSSEEDWRKLPKTRVQSTLAMMKKRALFTLLKKFKLCDA